MGNLTWEDYLEMVLSIEGSGEWVKEIAAYELRSGQNLKTHAK
jgi:hypothetical protein